VENQYLIPANAKKGALILNVFTMFDLIMFGTGIGITLLALMIFPSNGLFMTILLISPALITGMLVTPIPNYHNVYTVLVGMIKFYSERRIFIWKGWCINEYSKEK
jgi:hypothetical protein